jgi:hypothetical protein
LKKEILAFLLCLAVIFAVFWASAPYLFSKQLGKALEVPVKTNRLTVSASEVDITQLHISNPEGSVLPTAFTAKTFRIFTPFLNYFKEEIVIEEIVLDQIYLTIEFNAAGSKQGNWTTLMGNLKNSTKQGDQNKKVLIKKLVLTDITTDLVFDRHTGRVRNLPHIGRMEFANVSSQGGLPMHQIMSSVLGSMLYDIFEAYEINQIIEDILMPLRLL